MKKSYKNTNDNLIDNINQGKRHKMNDMTPIPDRLFRDIAKICVTHFQDILFESPSYLLNIILTDDTVLPNGNTVASKDMKDNYKRLDVVIKLLRTGDTRERLLSVSLRYLKQHHNHLRHSKTDYMLHMKDVNCCIQNFNDILMALKEISILFPWKEILYKKMIQFAMEYYNACLQSKVYVIPLEIPPEHIEIYENAYLCPYVIPDEEVKAITSGTYDEYASKYVDILRNFEHSISKDINIRGIERTILSPFRQKIDQEDKEDNKSNESLSQDGNKVLGKEKEEKVIAERLPTQGRQLKWYRDNHWQPFLKGRDVTIISGRHINQKRKIDEWFKDKVIMMDTEGKKYNYNMDIQIEWK